MPNFSFPAHIRLSQICAIVVFACIADKVYPNDVCYYNFNNDACNYGIAIGVIAFIDCLAFLVVDVMFDQQSNAQVRKYMVVADFIFSVMWSIMWFVGFCFLTDMWRRTDRGLLSGDTINNAQAAIAFSFFSIVIWVRSRDLMDIRVQNYPERKNLCKKNCAFSRNITICAELICATVTPSLLCNGVMPVLVHVVLHTFRCLLAPCWSSSGMLFAIALSFFILSFFRCFHFSVGNYYAGA